MAAIRFQPLHSCVIVSMLESIGRCGMKGIVILGAVLFVMHPGVAHAQTGHPIRVQIVYDAADASSKAVGPLLAQKFAANSKLFTVVKDQDDKDLSVVTDCYRESPNDPYSCFYAASKILGSIQFLLGGAVVVKKSPEDAASAILASIAQDIVERWSSTDRRMLISELETCLLLTESSCAVPTPLVSELKAKSINMSQYLRSGGLK